MTTKFPTPGDLFEDAYRIEAILGSGGFARVYRAVEIGLQRPVALKILRPPANNTQSENQRDDYLETLMQRFQQEALMLSKLRSSYTVNLYKYGKTEGGLLYMALEFIDGLSLAEILRAGKPLQPARVAKVLRQVLMSLQEAHSLGMLHRDLKPANIMVYEHLNQKDHVKLLDFGIAKLVTDGAGEHKDDLTGDGTLIGTPRYMAPEQIQGVDIGPAADIYALGLVGFELLTGERAIKGDSSIQIIGMQLAPGSFKLPDGDSIPMGLRHVVDKMMEKDQADRYKTCAEIIEDLERPSLLAADIDIPEIEIAGFESVEDLSIDDDGHDDPMATRENLLDTSGAFNGTTIAIFVGLLLVAAGIGLYATSVPGPPEATVPKVVKTPTVRPTLVLEEVKPEPKIKVTARLNGADVDGATILVDGVEKGVTPLTLKAEEIRGAKVTARYTVADREKPLEDTQEVTDPRDVLFEFDEKFGSVINPEGTTEPDVKPQDKRKNKTNKRKGRTKKTSLTKTNKRKNTTKRTDTKKRRPNSEPVNPYAVPE